ncbi:MAG: fructose-bisphosphatase class III [Coriobacteriales bacterium]|nr:fructose-bisphosphatase class III [Coriobacteriales bacterium]
MNQPLSQAAQVYVSDIHGEHRTFARILAEMNPAARLHMVGDIYDRGPAPDQAMDALAAQDNLDVQWGNHDMLWMAAAAGQPACVATVVRICARYGNLDVLTQTYGMDLSPLVDFAMSTYANDPCVAFGVKGSPDLDEAGLLEARKVQKAMAYIQFKVEHQVIADNPSFKLDHRDLLHHIDYAAGTIELDGTVYPVKDAVFPTIDPADPYRLTPDEARVMDYLVETFLGNKRLQDHIKVFLDKGSMYKIDGDVLLLHACVPLNKDGSLKESTVFDRTLAGRALYDAIDGYVRDAFNATDPAERKRGQDFLWWLWLAPGSPLFAKSKMATLEIYLIADKAAQKEDKNAFYKLLENEDAIAGIFRDFGMDPAKSRMIVGHTPVKVSGGEDPVKCGGHVMIIDGGMSRAYQPNSGIGGFVLVADADGAMQLGSIEPIALEPYKGQPDDGALHVLEWRALPAL